MSVQTQVYKSLNSSLPYGATMRLQKQLSKKRGKKIYYKYVLNIPPHDVKKAGWKGGEELIIEIRHKKAIIQKNKT